MEQNKDQSGPKIIGNTVDQATADNIAATMEFVNGGAAVRGEAVAGLPARRFVHVSGFLDADYIDFKAGEIFGGGVLNGVEYKSKHYTRTVAEEFVAEGDWREVEVSARAADAPSEPSEPEKLDTDQSREYLVTFMEQHFTDTTFHRYIRGQIGGSGPLAGDFAWQMARALRRIEAGVVESRAADALDSQPADPYPLLRAAFTTAESCADGYFVKFKFPTLQAMQAAHMQWHGSSSQPTDGGVRNGSEPGREDEDWFFSPNDGN